MKRTILTALLFLIINVVTFAQTSNSRTNQSTNEQAPIEFPWKNQKYEVLPEDLEGDYNWVEAKSACANLTAFGKNDWYLPNIRELERLHEFKKEIGGFSSDSYWSSTEHNDSDFAYVENFSGYYNKFSIYIDAYEKSYKLRVRCIRKVEFGSGTKFAEEKRISDSIANEKKRIADSIAREEERQRQEILENKSQSLYGEWIGKYGLFGKIKLVIDNTRMSFYLSGNLIEECPIKISVNGYDLRVEFLEKGDIYYRDELLLSYERQRTSYMQQIGYVTIRTYNYYNIKYEQGRFKVYCREVNESDNRAFMRSETKNTVVLYKSVEKKTSSVERETKIGKELRSK